jgi:hypothetical protein
MSETFRINKLIERKNTMLEKPNLKPKVANQLYLDIRDLERLLSHQKPEKVVAPLDDVIKQKLGLGAKKKTVKRKANKTVTDTSSYNKTKKNKNPTNELVNYYEIMPDDLKVEAYRNPNETFPLKHPFRVMIAGPTGAGKTNGAYNVIEMSGAFDRIFVFAKDTTESLYRFLERTYGSSKDKEAFFMSDKIEDLPFLEDFESVHGREKQTCIVFDDMITSGRKTLDKIAEYFIRGRKVNVSCIFLTQSYFPTPLTLRQNISQIMLYRLADKMNLNEILRQYEFGPDSKSPEGKLYRERVMNMYLESTEKDLNFFLISVLSKSDNDRYFHNFNQTFIMD